MKHLILIIACISASISYANIPDKMQIRSLTMKQDFVNLLDKAKDFHKAIQKNQSVSQEVAETKKIIKKLYTQVPSIKDRHKKLYTYKLLKSIEESISVLESQDLKNQKGKNHIAKKVFNSFFELAEVYNLKKDYSSQIFYCSSDKSTWFQAEKKASNPISPHLKNCGRRLF